jgi:hypothetical protein
MSTHTVIDNPSITHDLPTPHVAGFVTFGDLGLAKVYAQTREEYELYARMVAATFEMLSALKEISEISIYEIGDFRAVASRMQKQALAAIVKAEGTAS